MDNARNRLRRSAVTAAAILLLSAGPVLAQSLSVECSAFSRNALGGWTVLSPIMLDFGGLVLSPTVGTTFVAGSSLHGIEMTAVLDRECGNISR
jgi:hypothetical protein